MLMKKNREKTVEERYRRLQLYISGLYSAIVLCVTAFILIVILEKSNETIKENMSSMISANSRQLELNINSYLYDVETTAALMFSDEAYYCYDATDESLSEYEKIQAEDLIEDRIVDIGLMANYSDFCIVYADDTYVGWISKGTTGMFPDGGIYECFAGCIDDENKEDGWVFGIEDNVDRMYYVKRLNENAVLAASIYTKELDSVFEYPEQLGDMTIRLVNQEDRIMFSSDRDEIGAYLQADIVNLIAEKTAMTAISDDYLVNVNTCENNWRVVCSIPTEVLLKDNDDLRAFSIAVAFVLVIIFIIIGRFIMTRITNSMDGIVYGLARKADFDQLSGVRNKAAFTETVSDRLARYSEGRLLVFIMFDVDNFKQINDKLGHAHGDAVITRLGNLLKQMFDKRIPVGRLGGDEFAVYMEFTILKEEAARQRVIRDVEILLEGFAEEFSEEKKTCDISLSSGICIEKDAGSLTYEEMYTKADEALYISKNNGKNRYTIFSEDMHGKK